jgi:hypothetical protein
MVDTTPNEIAKELKAIREDLEYIKAHMVNMDFFLTPEEEKRLEASLEEYRTGKTTALKDFEKEMGKSI